MFQNTTKSEQFIGRTANFSTRGSRRGFVDVGVVVDQAALVDEPEAVRRQMQAAVTAYTEERGQLEEALMFKGANKKNWRNNVVYKFKGREQLFSDHPKKVAMLKRYFELGDLIQALAKHLSELPKTSTLGAVFMRVAKEVLPEDQFAAINAEALRIIKAGA